MSGKHKALRIKGNAIADVAAQGVARAMQARELEELNASEIDQVNGGAIGMQLVQFAWNPKWYGIWPEDFYGTFNNKLINVQSGLVENVQHLANGKLHP